MKKLLLLGLCLILFNACNLRVGNRQPDINYTWDISISPYYLKEYMKTIDSLYPTSQPITSEMVNFSENFIPVTDSVLGYKYVIEFYNLNNVKYLKRHYVDLASIYDFKKHKWIKDRDDLKNDELNKFKKFFIDSVLVKVVRKYQNKVPDSLLFVNPSKDITIKPLD